MANTERARKLAYLLRGWEECDDRNSGGHDHRREVMANGLDSTPERSTGTRHWRFSLEDPHTGERKGFSTFAALVAELEEQTR